MDVWRYGQTDQATLIIEKLFTIIGAIPNMFYTSFKLRFIFIFSSNLAKNLSWTFKHLIVKKAILDEQLTKSFITRRSACNVTDHRTSVSGYEKRVLPLEDRKPAQPDRKSEGGHHTIQIL